MSRQHSIDLLPQAIYARSQAGLRMGRFIAASVMTVVGLVVLVTHSRIALRAAEDELVAVSTQAKQVFATEARADELRKTLADTRKFIETYDRVSYPVEISGVLATVIRKLPQSVALDQIDLTAAIRQTSQTPRSKRDDKDQPPPPRILVGEISGFAATDQHIAELVSQLESSPPFREVSLDFSRTRDVRGQTAREFRLSFRIDLDAHYQVNASKSQAELEQNASTHIVKAGDLPETGVAHDQ
jgi:hypothetical protein